MVDCQITLGLIMIARIAVFTAAACLTFSAAQSAPAPPPVEAYAKAVSTEKISLSPSGAYMASINSIKDRRMILVRTLAGEVLLATPLKNEKVRNIVWVDDTHLLVQTSSTKDFWYYDSPVELMATFSIDIRAKKYTILFAADPKFSPLYASLVTRGTFGGAPTVFMTNIPKEGTATGTRLQTNTNAYILRDYPDLYKINLNTNGIEKVAGGNEDISQWVVGPDGQVTAYVDLVERERKWMLFHGDQVILHRTWNDFNVSLIGLGRTPNSVILRDKDQETTRYTEVTFSGATEDILPSENVTAVIHSPSTGLLIGAEIDDKRIKLFDPVNQAKIDAATKPFKGEALVTTIADNLDKLVVHTEGDGDAGTLYLVNLVTHRADILDQDYPDIAPENVGPVSRFSYQASDGLEMDAILTLPPGRPAKNLPVVVLPHGGPIDEYDVVHFDWLAQAFASRGYAVLQPNYRGSGGHGATFRKAGMGEWGGRMLSDIADGLSALAKAGVADPHRACIVGFSYGGYASLAGVTLQNGLYRCAVAGSGISNMVSFDRWRQTRVGDESLSYQFWRKEIGAGRVSLDAISPVALARKADAPILLIHGLDDTVVPIEQSQEMERALKAAGKPVEALYTKGEDHWLSREATRTETLKAAVAFVQKYNPAD